MKINSRILQCSLGLMALTSVLLAEPPAAPKTETAEQVKAWVAQLKDSDYAKRNAAVLALIGKPDDALPLLEQQLKTETNSNHRWWLKVAIRECEEKQTKPGEISASPDDSKSLQVCATCQSESPFVIIERDGFRCWKLSQKGQYLYFSASGEFRKKAYPKLEIEVEFLDIGTEEISLDYDSTDPQAAFGGAYKNHPKRIHRTNSGQWRKTRFHLPNARFLGSENQQTDFRFWNGGNDMIIRAVRVWPSRAND